MARSVSNSDITFWSKDLRHGWPEGSTSRSLLRRLRWLTISTVVALLLGAAGLTTAIARAETACHIEQSGPENGVIHATGLAPLGHNKLYDVLVLGPAKQSVNEYVLFPGEEAPLFFNTRFGAGTYEGQVWEAHRINKAKESPPAVERDKELSSCSASLT